MKEKGRSSVSSFSLLSPFAMETSSVLQLCLQLISSAIRRCRVSEQLCRVSLLLKCFQASDCSAVGVSISDTGIGSRLEEFQDLKYPDEDVGSKKWDGVLSVRTTNYCDNEIYHYQINLKESVSTRRLQRKPSTLKNGAKFSGTEVYLLISESINVLLEEMYSYFQKILILKIPNVITELAVERGDIQGSQQGGTVFIQNNCSDHPLSASNLDCLKIGFEDYVLKHGYHLKCDSCFTSRKVLKVGAGMLSCTEKQKKLGLVAEAVVAISQACEPTNCVKACALETRVIWFKDFAPCSTSPRFLKALAGIDWKRYGLILAGTIDWGYHALLKWENLPSDTHIDIAIHCYHGQSLTVKNSQISQSLIKNAVKKALDDLKQNHGVLLSAHALKICSHAPDLARTMAGLILNSNDTDFQEECFSLLGLQFQEADIDTVKENIKGKIISVVEMNDRISPAMKEVAPFLFEDEQIQETETEDDKYEVGEDDLNSTSTQI